MCLCVPIRNFLLTGKALSDWMRGVGVVVGNL
jgi:hypothetical protein